MKSLDALEKPLYDLFTVVIDLDSGLNITGVSPLISRKIPEIKVGQPLVNFFELIRPRTLTPDDVEAKLDNLVLLISRNSRYPIRGQIFHSTKKIGGYVLVGSPWLSRMVEEGNEDYSLSDFPLHDAQVDWLFMLGTEQQQVKDLKRLSSELELAKNAAEDAIESKSKFFAIMSHEMRTPLNAIIGATHLMPQDNLDTESRKLLDVSASAANQLLSVINDVLDYSKIEAGQMSLEITQFQLGPLIEAVLNIVSPNIGKKQLQLSYTVDENLPEYLKGDDGKVKQVLLNLVANALRFTESGSITVNAKQLHDQNSSNLLRIEVSDTGVGISLENQQKLFDEFWTSSADSGFQGRGTGLGLDIAKRLTELMGGEIGVSSELNKGSVFWFEIPVQAVTERKTPEPSVPSDVNTQQLEGKRILVAEDNQANQLIARLSLEKLGMVVEIASNGLEAVDAVEKRPFDIVFMDLGMPEMSGYEAAAEIRQTLGQTELPIIACTAHSKATTYADNTKGDFDDYLAKPITRENMLDILLTWVGGQESERVATSNQSPESQASEAPDIVRRLNEADILDSNTLNQLAIDLGGQHLEEALRALRAELNSRIATIHTAKDRKEYEIVARESHALKSGTLSLGASRLSLLLGDIEKLADLRNELVWQQLELLNATCTATLAELDSWSPTNS